MQSHVLLLVLAVIKVLSWCAVFFQLEKLNNGLQPTNNHFVAMDWPCPAGFIPLGQSISGTCED